MSAFFFSNGPRWNAAVELSELEAAMTLLASPGAPLNKDYRQWQDYARTIAKVFLTRGKLIILLDSSSNAGCVPGWRGPLKDAPPTCRSRIRIVAACFVPKGASYDDAEIEVIA